MKSSFINYQNKVSTNSIDGTKSLTEVLNLIKNGDAVTDAIINKARKHGKGTKEYDDIKTNQLPAFLFNFNFSGKLATENITASTGLLYMDIDNIESESELSALREEVKQVPYTLACWKSLSGQGLSILVSVKGMHQSNYHAFKNHFKYWYEYDANTGSGLNLDENTWKPTQKTVLSKDENIYINMECADLGYIEARNTMFYVKAGQKVKLGTLLKKKYNIGHQTTPLFKTGGKSSSTKNGFIFTDRHLYADADKDYTIYPEGIEVNKIFFSKGNKIKVGSRANILFVSSCKFVRMNGEDMNNLMTFLKMVRKNFCENPQTLSNAQLSQIANSVLKSYKSAKIKMSVAKVIFHPHCLYTLKQKQSISGKVIAKLKADKTIALFTALYKPKMKQRELSALSKMSERTVKAYWRKRPNGTIYFDRPKPPKDKL